MPDRRLIKAVREIAEQILFISHRWNILSEYVLAYWLIASRINWTSICQTILGNFRLSVDKYIEK